MLRKVRRKGDKTGRNATMKEGEYIKEGKEKDEIWNKEFIEEIRKK